MKSLLITTALTLALAVPAAAQQGAQMSRDRTGPYASDMGPTVSPQAVSARLISAEQLIQKNVVSADGRDIGSVDYIVVDPVTGDITTLLVRGSGIQRQTARQQGGQGQAPLVAIPWHAIDISLGETGEVVAKAPMQMIRQVPTFTDQEIDRVTSPRIMAQVVEYYGPAKAAGQDQATGRQRSDRMGMDSRSDRQQGTAQGRTGQNQRQSGQQQADSSPQILLGRDIVGMLAPPAVTTADQMRGLTITADNGQEIGQVDLVMINADRGSIDYVLVEQAGPQPGLVPIAYDDLSLAPDGQSFTLEPDAIMVGVVAVPRSDTGPGGRNAMSSDRQQMQAQAQGQTRGYGSDVYGRSESRGAQAGQNQNRQANAGQSQNQSQDQTARSASPQNSGTGDTAASQAGTQRTQNGRTADAGQQDGRIQRTVLGTIEEIDRRNRLVTLENGSEFRLDEGVQVQNIASGDQVRVNYDIRNNDYIATAVRSVREQNTGSNRSGRAEDGNVSDRGGNDPG